MQMSRIDRLFSHVPPGQFGRYLIVGAWNTLFGYGVFAALVAVLDPVIPHGYILANLLASIIAITVAFFGYKLFVFKTKGNYLKEWLRCLAVYGGGVALSMVLLPLVVELLHYGLGIGKAAPYVAGALITMVLAAANFMGHKRFSFRQHPPGIQDPGIQRGNASGV